MAIKKKVRKTIELEGITKSNMWKNQHIKYIARIVRMRVAYFVFSDKLTTVYKAGGGGRLYELYFKNDKTQKEVNIEFRNMGAKYSV